MDGLDFADPAMELTMGAVRYAFAAWAAAPCTRRVAGAAGAVGDAGAAVLVALVPCDGSGSDSAASVVLIRRAAHLRANPGEIAFPGGRIEPGEDPLATALREAEEEVALPADAVEALGELSIVHAVRGSVAILPFVAAAPLRPALEANPAEVDCILIVPLAELVAPGRYWQEQWDRADDPAWTMHFFDLGEDMIWGATARMLHALFLRLLRPRVSLPVPP